LSRDLPGTGSKTCACGVSVRTESLNVDRCAVDRADAAQTQATLLQVLRQPDISMIVPTLRVGMPARTLCVQVDAERQSLRYHAERGNDQATNNAKSVSSSPRCSSPLQPRHHKTRLGPTERRRSEGTRRSRAQPGARTLGYLVSFQVTRRRRNRSGVSQNKYEEPAQARVIPKPKATQTTKTQPITHKKPRDKRGVFQMLPGGYILPSNTKINRITRIVPIMPDGP
jgi:hypothetical protein